MKKYINMHKDGNHYSNVYCSNCNAQPAPERPTTGFYYQLCEGGCFSRCYLCPDCVALAPSMATGKLWELVNWLYTCPGVTQPKPVYIRFGESPRLPTYQGATYYQDGERRVYLLGDVPGYYKRQKKTTFMLDTVDSNWHRAYKGECPAYICAYMSAYDFSVLEIREPEKAKYHPFGASFILAFSHDFPGYHMKTGRIKELSI